MLNSTALGEVLTERQLRRDRMRAGLRLGDRTVDLFAYVGWLAAQRHWIGKRADPEEGDPYEKVKEAARARAAKVSLAGRDIGEIPPVEDPQRRARALASFRAFCECYYPDVFYLPWSRDHLEVIGTLEDVVFRGGSFAVAMPRGSGKTSLCEAACVFAVLTGTRRFVVLIGAEEQHAGELLESIKTELACNDRLLADFPEAVYPIRCLEGLAHRCRGQLHHGRPTRIEWSAKHLVFPTIEGSAASGAVLRVTGLLGRIRGMKFTRADGRVVRPELVVIEDPQTEASAVSPTQNERRERIISQAILNLGGPGVQIGAMMPCTVIAPGDMADNLLNRKLHPEWQGRRYQLVYEFPTNEKLWQQYTEILREPSRSWNENLALATAFYREHREAMDEGARVAWPERYGEGEISALQHAMNLRIRDESMFAAEMQNRPLRREHAGDWCTAEEICGKLSGLARGIVPADATIVAGHVDVHDKLLYWTIIAVNPNLAGAVVDYATYPEQARSYFTMREARPTLGKQFAGAGRDGAIYKGLEALLDDLCHREWEGQDGSMHRLNRLLVDEGYKDKTVRAAIRASKYRALIMPSRGLSLRAAHKPMSEWKRSRGERVGHNWRIPKPEVGQARGVQFDANFWKSTSHTLLKTAPGDAGCLQVWGDDPKRHRMFADHVAESEYFVTTYGRGRAVNEWQERPNHPDNHHFDNLVGALVAASVEGAQIPGTGKAKKKKPRIRVRR